ncbi:hypothetical protein ACF1BE_06655 [Streptomyces sp. NPDC014991]|uniref:hypothetical protein n=1 Tax=Streptomyces sp. NPDC014991 TaxID=3364935 RepID=UPI0036FC39B2
MTDRNEHRGDRFDRARSPEEPGAHSGSESQAQERVVPGTAGAKEGYRTEHGTTAGKPLEGVEAEDLPEGDQDAEDSGRSTGL